MPERVPKTPRVEESGIFEPQNADHLPEGAEQPELGTAVAPQATVGAEHLPKIDLASQPEIAIPPAPKPISERLAQTAAHQSIAAVEAGYTSASKDPADTEAALVTAFENASKQNQN